MINNINVRFFVYASFAYDETGSEIVEITENQFKKLSENKLNPCSTTYERHTVRENGVNQICLTLEAAYWPPFEELELLNNEVQL